MGKLSGMLSPALFWRLKRLKMRVLGSFLRGFAWLGVNISRTRDPYSPLPVQSKLIRNQKRWDKPSALSGLRMDVTAFKALFADLRKRYATEWSLLPSYNALKSAGFGPGYPQADALTLYAMLRELKPKRYLEVGSGLSTYIASLAAAKNATENSPINITCIEPYPYDKLYSIANIHVLKQEAQATPLSVFDELEAGDVFFIDSTHIAGIDSDVTYLFLEILPRLKRGVIIHVHDVHFPYNTPYPADFWVVNRDWPMLWNEAMLLQAFLAFNDSFEVMFSLPMIRQADPSFISENLQLEPSIGEPPTGFSSIWLKRVK